jgi:hypothetical protein
MPLCKLVGDEANHSAAGPDGRRGNLRQSQVETLHPKSVKTDLR